MSPKGGVAVALVSVITMIVASVSFTSTAVDTNGATWSPRVTVAQGAYGVSDLYIGSNYEYILTWDYPSGPVYVMRSSDSGATWSAGEDVFGYSIWGAWPSMCGYVDGTSDVLVVVAQNIVAMSRDNGDSFQAVGTLPAVGSYWTSMSVGTRASWLGQEPDNEIFVAGTVNTGASFVIAFTKSLDGGVTWSQPVYPCGVSSSTYWPTMVSDGTRICLVYSILNNVGPWGQEDFDLHVRYSDDWGATWSEDVMLSDSPTGEHRVSWQMQYVGGHRAILTFMDQVFSPGSAIVTAGVNYGYLDMKNLTYTQVGMYSDGGWIGYGVSGVLQADGRFSIAYVENVPPSNSIVYYASSYDTGLATITGTHEVVKGPKGPRSSAVSWEYAPSNYGTWTGRIANNGLRSLVIDVYDVTTGVPEEIMHQRIMFAANDAFPYGVVNTSGVEMSPTHRYMITATPNGPRGSSCVVEDMFESQGMPPEADYVLAIHESDIYTVHADGSTSYSPNGMIVSYEWDFGDGSTATGMTADHTYSSIGLFQITLKVTDNIGLQDTAAFWVHIYPVFVRFNITVTDYTVTVDASFIDPDGMIASYAWDWGDGATGSSATATHTYPVVGTYLITLVTTDFYGNTEQASQYVTVPNPLA